MLDSWLWLGFVVWGLFLVLLELAIGVETGFDLVIIGSAFIIGGLVTWPLHSWLITVIVTGVICLAYLALGRRYVHRRSTADETRTNIDSVIGKSGIVLQSITKNTDGLVQVGNEQWRARADENINKGDEIIVTDIQGVTLIVQKPKGGS